ncbi:hypothetical protein PtB15_18B223 [Puccinia triticina]|nr:hypothetical protein PtB15_18B223 [Puccinia triticina]
MISSINPAKPPDRTEIRQKELELLAERYAPRRWTGQPKEQKPKPKSTLLEGLHDLRKESKNHTLIQTSKRSTSILSRAERPIQPPAELRGSDLTVNVNIPLGPIKFQPSTLDPDFLQIEPNSETRLKKRLLSHQTLQDYLSDRYVVRINELYAIIRKVELGRFQGGTEWKVPLVGDWVLFGVIGQKSDFKTTNPYIASQFNRMGSTKPENEHQSEQGTSKAKGAAAEEDEEEVVDELNDELQRDDQCKKKGNQDTAPEEPAKPKPKKFVTFKLIDLSSSKISSSGSGVINMILFEADTEIPNGQEPNMKTYRGGSGGAYEKFWKEQPGTLIGIMNPKVLKNRPQPSGYSRPKTEILSITPENQQSIFVVGRAKDLGSCVAKRLDTGNECGDWCDLRNCSSQGSNLSAICDFHLQRQVKKVRASRAEFFAGTSGMVQHTGKSFAESYGRKGKKTDKCDPTTKTGLLPPTQSKRTSINGQITYICGGSGSSLSDVTRNSRMKKFEERYSRATDVDKVEGMKLKRKRELEEIEMNKILTDQKEKNDNYGFKCIQDAKLALKKTRPGSTSNNAPPKAKKRHLPAQDKPSSSTGSSTRSVYSTAAVRAIGFDPTHQTGSKAAHLHSNEPTKNTSSAAYNDLLERCPQKQEIFVSKANVKGKQRAAALDSIEGKDADNDSGDGDHLLADRPDNQHHEEQAAQESVQTETPKRINAPHGNQSPM